MPQYKDEAVMLRSYPFGEGGQIVSFLTLGHGKMRGHARSSRRMKSPFGSSLEPMSRCEILYFHKEGRELVTLDHTSILATPWIRCARDLDAAWHIQYMAELVELTAQEGEPEPLLYRLLASVVDAVAAGSDIRRITTYFELWLLRLQGVLPDLARCSRCGEDLDDRAWLDVPQDLLLCPACAGGASGRTWLERDVLTLLGECLRRPVAQIASGEMSPHTPRAASSVLRQLLQRYIGREVRSLRFLDSLESLPK